MASRDIQQTRSMDKLLKDLPVGPLDIYRKKASFDWKLMKFYLEGEDIIHFKVYTVTMYILLLLRDQLGQQFMNITLLTVITTISQLLS